jgi:hypothetical protein
LLIHIAKPAWTLAGMGQSRMFRLHLVTVPGGLTRRASASRFTMQPYGLGYVVLMMA